MALKVHGGHPNRHKSRDTRILSVHKRLKVSVWFGRSLWPHGTKLFKINAFRSTVFSSTKFSVFGAGRVGFDQFWQNCPLGGIAPQGAILDPKTSLPVSRHPHNGWGQTPRGRTLTPLWWGPRVIAPPKLNLNEHA